MISPIRYDNRKSHLLTVVTNVKNSSAPVEIPKKWISEGREVKYSELSKSQPYARIAAGNQLVTGTIIDGDTAPAAISTNVIFTDGTVKNFKVKSLKPSCRCARNLCTERPVTQCGNSGILLGPNGTQIQCDQPNPDLPPIEYC